MFSLHLLFEETYLKLDVKDIGRTSCFVIRQGDKKLQLLRSHFMFFNIYIIVETIHLWLEPWT